MNIVHFAHMPSPIGRLMIAATANGLHAIEFPENRHPVARDGRWVDVSDHPQWQADQSGPVNSSAAPDKPDAHAPHTPDSTPAFSSAPPGATASAHTAQSAAIALLIRTRRQLDEYFSGQRHDFDLPLAPEGTAFQREVWQALCEIPFGQTWSYAQLARHIGRPKAMRAVGAANGRNPIPIIIPCHRVIGASGALVGFGGGLPAKVALLRLEGIHASLPDTKPDTPSPQLSLLPPG